MIGNIVNAPGPMVIILDAGILQANKHGSLPLPSILSIESTINTIVPVLKSSSLFSLGQVCDDVCNVALNKQKIYAIRDKELVIEGERNHRYGLWVIIIPAHPNDKNIVQTKN